MKRYKLSRDNRLPATGGILALLLPLLALWATGCGLLRIPPNPETRTATAEPGFADAIGRSRDLLRTALRRRPGLSVAVGAGGRIVWAEGLGWASLEPRRPATAETPFRIYSVAKCLTATLAVRLAEEGRMNLDRRIGMALPVLPPALASLTMRELLGHVSGIRDYRSGEWVSLSRQGCRTAIEATAALRNDPLESAPGAKFSYSSFNYVLASAVIEAQTGKPYYELLREEILDPAGMTHTVPDDPGAERAAGTEFFEPGLLGRVRTARPVDNSCKFGAGGLLASAADLVRFGSAILAGALVSGPQMATMMRPEVLTSGKPEDYGIGFGLVDVDGVPLAAHSGGAIGGRSYLLIDRTNGIVVALASNVEGEKLSKEAVGVWRMFLQVPKKSGR